MDKPIDVYLANMCKSMGRVITQLGWNINHSGQCMGKKPKRVERNT